jgi:hypothetical protein
MRAFFEAIQTLFVDFLFLPWDALRHLEPSTWWGANAVNWIFMAVCAYFFVYWCRRLIHFDSTGEENKDVTAHSFLD